MKPECSAIKEKMFCILSIISLFTAKYKKRQKTRGEHLQSVLIP